MILKYHHVMDAPLRVILALQTKIIIMEASDIITQRLTPLAARECLYKLG
jgi:hypothetical protein